MKGKLYKEGEAQANQIGTKPNLLGYERFFCRLNFNSLVKSSLLTRLEVYLISHRNPQRAKDVC